MLAGLDPHSSYMDPKKASEICRFQTTGKFGGLGIEVTMEDGLIKVVAAIDDTPAYKAGIMTTTSSLISTMSRCKGSPLVGRVEKMRGPPNTTDQAQDRTPRPRPTRSN